MAGAQRLKRLNKSCILLIAIAGIERFAFKGVSSNLVTYLTDVVKLSNSSAAKMVNSWVGFTSIMPLLVAPIADRYCHKYSTIMASSFLYFMGLVALTSTTLARSWYDRNRTMSSSFLSLSLYLISLGQGGYNPSLQAFGAEQFDDDDEEEELPLSKGDTSSKNRTLFFQWWYFGICGGSLMGVTIMSYIQDTFGWVIGFAIPAISMLISILVFSCGSPIYFYTHHDDEHQAKKHFMNIYQAIKSFAFKCFHSGITISNDKLQVVELELEEKPLCSEKLESLKDSKSDINVLSNAKVVIRLFPIWTMLLMFAVIFQQPATFFTKQGMTMERNIIGNLKIPPATLQSAITLSIILLMPLYDKIFIPIAKLITHQDKGISVTQRMGIGMVLSIIAMVIATIVEMKRLDIGRALRNSGSGSVSETVPLSIFWLLPQYILLGISDIFTVVGMQEFFYGEVPKTMRTMGIALYTSVFGVGSFVSALLITLVEVYTTSKGTLSWFCDDMNEARLDNYYYLLTWLSVLSFLFYVLLCKYYHNRSDSHTQN